MRLSKKKLFFPTFLLIAVFGVLAQASPAAAQELGFVAGTLAYIASIIIELAGKLLIVMIELLLVIVKYNDFINAPAVERGWILIRDFANMAFLIIFIAIAYATILGVEKYEWKRLLPKLLMVAVAVNFSKTICGLIIDAAQVAMITFVNGFKDVAAGNLVNGLGLSQMLSLRELGTDESVTDTAVAVASILAVILLVIAVMVVGAIVLMFLVRIMYLWILIILAPVAFLMAATPGAEHLFQEWWKKLVRYAFVGPIMTFWLWLSFSVMAGVAPGENLAQQNKFYEGAAETGFLDVSGNTAAAISGISRSDQLLSYGLSIGLLLYSLMVARGLAIKGSSLADSALGTIKRGGIKLGKLAALGVATGGVGAGLAALGGYKAAPQLGKAAWFGAKYLDQKRYAKTGKSLNLKRAVGEWKAKFQETKRKDEIIGAGQAYQLMAQGGAKGLFYGATGASRDAAEWYGHGFLGLGKEGGIARAWRTVTGGPQRAADLAKGVKEQQDQEARARAEVAVLREALGKHDFFTEGREAYIEQGSKTKEEEILERFNQANAETVKEKRQKMLADQVIREHGETLTFASEWAKKIGDDRVMASKLNLTPAELRAENLESRAIEKEELIKEWAKRKARYDIGSKVDKIIARDGTQSDQEVILKELHSLGQARMRSKVATKAVEVTRLEKDGLSDLEVGIRGDQLKRLNEAIVKLTNEIGQNQTLGLAVTPLTAQLRDTEQKRNAMGVQDEQGAWHVTTDINVIAEEEKKHQEALAKAQSEEEIKKLNQSFDAFKKSRSDALAASQKELGRLRTLQGAPTWDDARRKEVADQIDTLEAQAGASAKKAEQIDAERRKFEAPRGFYAGRARRLLEDEEMRKITSEESTELIADFKTALHEGDKVKAAALLKKLAKDANDNEIFNAFGFTSNAQGMHDFFNAVVVGPKGGKKGVKKADGTEYTGPSLGLDEQTAYALENDVAYINEGVNHWNTARMMEVKNGRYEQLANEDHVKASLAEILKKDPTDVIRNFNRLAYGGERPKPDGTRDFEMDALGLVILKAFAKEYKFRYGRSEFNKNAVMNIGKTLDDLSKYGVDPEYITLTREKYASFEKAGGDSPAKIAEEVFKMLRSSGAL